MEEPTLEDYFNEIFGIFDRDGDGVLDGDELRHFVAFNFSLTLEDVTASQVADCKKVFGLLGDDGEGEVEEGGAGEDKMTREALSSHELFRDALTPPRGEEVIEAVRKYAQAEGWQTMIKPAKKN